MEMKQKFTITEETKEKISRLEKRVRELKPEKQKEEVIAFVISEAFELVYHLGSHKDKTNAEYVKKKQEYEELLGRLGEYYALPSGLLGSLINIENNVK
ncbi:MAG: hypothetical protein PHH54_07090 [Candidatus Nanoarchaeia archaeon]|nr:hypothetical protein [Candidatus Nanoarchaeia archaeon]MDD5741720.1 hypothetical protein [Candidatus Nanoarchaeia archaeon]